MSVELGNSFPAVTKLTFRERKSLVQLTTIQCSKWHKQSIWEYRKEYLIPLKIQTDSCNSSMLILQIVKE